MSSQWMPFVLYASGASSTRAAPGRFRRRARAGGAELSCGYFLLYFAPFAAAYVLYEIASRGQ